MLSAVAARHDARRQPHPEGGDHAADVCGVGEARPGREMGKAGRASDRVAAEERIRTAGGGWWEGRLTLTAPEIRARSIPILPEWELACSPIVCKRRERNW